jgi:hypothetical protein
MTATGYVAHCPGCNGVIHRPAAAPPRPGYNDEQCPTCGHCVVLRGGQYERLGEPA